MENKKIIVTSDGDSLDSMVDQRFGRCKYFVLVEIEKGEIKNSKAIENKGAMQGHGAGVSAAQQAGELGAEAVLTGNIGPNATQILEKLGVKSFKAFGIVKNAIKDFIEGKLGEIEDIAAPHSGMQPNENKVSERIFFPLLDNKGMDSEISGHFGHAPFFGLYDMATKKLTISENKLDHTDPTKSPVDQIVEAVNPTTVFALGIGARAIQLFNERGIALKTGPYRTVKEAIDNLKNMEEQAKSCGHGHH